MATPDVLSADPPRLSRDDAREVARGTFGVEGSASALVSERDQNFLVTEPAGSAWILKISNAAEDPAVVEMEVAAIEHVARVDPALPVPVARRAREGGPVASVTVGGAPHLVRLLPALPGANRAPTDLGMEAVREIGTVVARLGLALRSFFHSAAGRAIAWDQKQLPALRRHAALVEDARRRAQLERILDRFAARVVPAWPKLRAQVIHNDVTLDNLLLDADGHVTGIVDFGDMAHTALMLDVPASLQSLVRDRGDVFAVADAFLDGYTALLPLEPLEADLLGDLLAGRMAQTILISAWRTGQYPDNAYITGWAEPAWALLDQLEAVGLDQAGRRLAALARLSGASAARPSVVTDEDLVGRRQRVLGSALSPLTYRQPLHLVRGRGAWMFDPAGRGYLDAYNNVPVVGHAHPRVAAAIASQAATLNTNTRYLHASVVELAERIVASMPPGLDTVMFVNSGSEANDLAWRLATTASGGRGGVVTRWAYHGVTAAIADLSPSEWPRGERPAHVETIDPPDGYRGRYRDVADPAQPAGADMRAALDRLGERNVAPAALYLDTLFTADGIFSPPAALVAAWVAELRAAGGLFVADEVQAGHGRSGGGLWAFADWGLAPDIVTLGKPMGNGHPIAAVVTRAEVVNRLAAETEFFSTFGGNPVACAAALAVLDVIGDDGLVEHAAREGARLRDALQRLAERHSAIGDVRGRGLMTGVELVSDPLGRTPDGRLAAAVKDAMRERGVLIGTTGRDGNVLKIRPPLVIAPEEVDLIVTTLEDALTAAEAAAS